MAKVGETDDIAKIRVPTMSLNVIEVYVAIDWNKSVGDFEDVISESLNLPKASFSIGLNKLISDEPWRRVGEYKGIYDNKGFFVMTIRMRGGGKRARTTTTERHSKAEKFSLNDVRLKATNFDATTKVDTTLFQRVQERVKDLTTNMDDKWFADKLESMPRQKVAELHNLISETRPQEQSIAYYVPFFVEEYTMCETLGDECTKAMAVLKYAFNKKFIEHYYDSEHQM